MPSSRESSKPTDWNCVSYISCILRWVLYHQCHQGSKYSRKKPHYGNNHFFLHQHQNLRAQARVPWIKPQHCTNTTIRRRVHVCVCECSVPQSCLAYPDLAYFPDKNTGVWCHLMLQETFPTQGSNLSLPYSALAGGHFSATWETQGGKSTP